MTRARLMGSCVTWLRTWPRMEVGASVWLAGACAICGFAEVERSDSRKIADTTVHRENRRCRRTSATKCLAGKAVATVLSLLLILSYKQNGLLDDLVAFPSPGAASLDFFGWENTKRGSAWRSRIRRG